MPLSRLKSGTAVLKDARFRTFFIGNTVSKLGDAPVPVAFSLAAYQVSDSAAGITSVLLSLWVARFLMVAPGGRWADQHNRVTMMMTADVLRIGAQAGLALLVLGPIQLQSWHLCVSAAVYGIGTGLYNPAQLGLTPELVPEERLQEANGLLSVVADLGFLLGPALAGVLMGTVGFSWVLWLDCASFAVNLALLLRLRRIWTPTRHTAAPAADGPATAEQPADDDRFVAGFAVMARYPWFGAGMALWFVVSLGIGLVAVAGPVIAVDSLGGTGAWSVLATCLAVGSLLGSLAVVAATRRYAWRTAAAAVALGAVLQFVALALHDRMPLALVGAAFALTALTTAACGVIWDSAYQSEIPERYVSRLASVDNFVNSAGTPVGMLLGGLLAAHYDTLFLGLAVATALLCIPAAGLAAPARKAVRP